MDKDRLIELWDQLSEWQKSLVIKAILYMIEKGAENESTEEEGTSA